MTPFEQMKQFTNSDAVGDKRRKLATLILGYEQLCTNTKALRACESLDDCCRLLMDHYQTTEDQKIQQQLMTLYVQICCCQFDIELEQTIPKVSQQTAERLRAFSAELEQQQHAGLNTLLTQLEQLKPLVSEPAVKPAIDTLYSRLAEFSNLCEVAAPVSELALLSRVLFFVSDPARRQVAGVAKVWRAAASVAWEERLQRNLPAVFAARNGRTDYPRMLVEHARAQLVAHARNPIVNWEEYTSDQIRRFVSEADSDLYCPLITARYFEQVQYCILAGYPVSCFIGGGGGFYPKAPLLYKLLGVLRVHTADNQTRPQILKCIELLLDFGAETHFRILDETIADQINRLTLRAQVQVITLLNQYRHEFTADEFRTLFGPRSRSEEGFLALVDSLPLSAENRRLWVINYLDCLLSYHVIPRLFEDLISRLQLSEPGVRAQIIAARASHLLKLVDFTAEDLCQKSEGSPSFIEIAFAENHNRPAKHKMLFTTLLRAPGTFTLEPQAAGAILRKLAGVWGSNKQELNILLLSLLDKGFTVEDCLAVIAEDVVIESQSPLIAQYCTSDADVQEVLRDNIREGKATVVKALTGANILSVDGKRMSAAEYALIHGRVDIAEQLAKRSLAIIFLDINLEKLTPEAVVSRRSRLPKHLQLFFPLCGLTGIPDCIYLDKPARYAAIPGIEAHILKMLPADYQITATSPGTLNLIQGACVFRNAKLLEFLLEQFNVDLNEMPLTVGQKSSSLLLAAFDNVRDHADLQALKDTVAVLQEHGLRLSAAEQEILKSTKQPFHSTKLGIVRGIKVMIDELCERSCVLTTALRH